MRNHTRHQRLPSQREVHFKRRMSFPNYIGTVLRRLIIMHVLVRIFFMLMTEIIKETRSKLCFTFSTPDCLLKRDFSPEKSQR